MSTTAEKALFYHLTTDQLLEDLSLKISDAQRRVYTYWKTIDPKGYRIIPVCTQAIADALKLTRRTVQLALNALTEKKLLRWNKSHGLLSKFDDRQGENLIAKAKISQFELAIEEDRQGERRIALANAGSPRRTQDRERGLEVNQGMDSEGHKIINYIKNKDLNIDQEEFLNFENSENLGNSGFAIKENNEDLGILINEDTEENSDLSFEQIAALIRSGIDGEPDELIENLDELDEEVDDEPIDDQPIDDQPIDEEIDDADFEASIEPITRPIKTNPPEKPKTLVEVDSFRRAVENFILQTLNKSFPTEDRRAAYFRKFDAKSWKKWETDYRESIKPMAEFKPFVPEKVEVAAPDSPIAQSYIAQIKAKLGIKS